MHDESTFSTPTPQHKVYGQRRFLIDQKDCEICGATMHRPLDMEPWQFNRRATCSSECQAEKRWRTRGRRGAFSETKVCTICGGTYTRKCGNSKQWAASTVCGHECRMAKVQAARQIDRSTVPTRTCPICGVVLFCGEDEDPCTFLSRKTCGSECAAVFRGNKRRGWARKASKPCEICGVFFSPNPKEPPVIWEERQTCSHECHYLLSGRNRRFGVTSSKYPPEWGEQRYFALERDQHCQFCGAVDKLHVHHINYDKQNCGLDNLIVLCGSCHGKTTHGDRTMWAMKCREILNSRDLLEAA